MGLLEAIKEKLFGNDDQSGHDADTGKPRRPEAADPTTASVPAAANLESEVAATLGGANAEPARVGPNGPVDVVGLLDAAADRNGGGPEWRDSIVNLLKILGLDAGLEQRKALAGELGYAGDKEDEATMDACLIAAAQRSEHYEMAAYGTLIAWAKAMGHNEAAELLEQTLEEEKAADEKLTSIAESGINKDAAESAHPEGELPSKGREMVGAGKRNSRR